MPKLLLTGALLLASTSMLAGQGKVPPLHAPALSGQTVDFPRDLQGHTTVLIVSFSQDARDTVTGWFRRLADDYRTSPTVLYFALPDLSGAPGFLRGTITRKIKDSVAPPAQPRFVPILSHDDEWKSVTGFSRKTPGDQAWVLLVDGTGTIREHFPAGAPTDQTYASLRHQIEQIH